MKKLILIFSFLNLISCGSQKEITDQTFTKIDSLIQLEKPRKFSGVVVVAKNDKILFSKSRGFADLSHQIPVKIGNRFSTMSIAKQITATLVMLEVEKGTVDLNSPIKKYLPELKFNWTDKVTVHQLLNNTSGIDAWKFNENLLFEPGTKFRYSNMGYALLGKILENVTKKPYSELVNNLFTKIGMKDSFYPDENIHLIQSFFIKKDGTVNPVSKFPFDKEVFPGGNLAVTAPDLVKWNLALHNGKILKNEFYQKMIHYNISDANEIFDNKTTGYGYGLRINDKAEVFEIGHTGFSPVAGFTTVNLYYPKNKISVIVLENTATDDFDNAYFFENQVRNIVVKSNLVK